MNNFPTSKLMLGLSTMKKENTNRPIYKTNKVTRIIGHENVNEVNVNTMNLDKNSQDMCHKDKRKWDQRQSKSKGKKFKKNKLCGDSKNLESVEPNTADKTNSNSYECEESVSIEFAPINKPKKKAKKKKCKSVENGSNEVNQACLSYLNEWKNDNESWKFEKIKQIRLTSMMFDKEKLPNEYFNIFLEYMEKASHNMKKLLTTKASEVIFNVEKWNDLNDKGKLTSPKPKSYEGYERARDLLQRFE